MACTVIGLAFSIVPFKIVGAPKPDIAPTSAPTSPVIVEVPVLATAPDPENSIKLAAVPK